MFPGVEIKGGVCYFSGDRDYSGDCEVVTVQKGVAGKGLKRPLRAVRTFYRFRQAVSILEKWKSYEEEQLRQFRRPSFPLQNLSVSAPYEDFSSE